MELENQTRNAETPGNPDFKFLPPNQSCRTKSGKISDDEWKQYRYVILEKWMVEDQSAEAIARDLTSYGLPVT